ncbi:MAG: ATP-dependent Clp protease adaptor ClpS [Candidatus Delongbacteria bacterium]|jgi:ATP-dependent Clp protease adaptor protein ClpS|nr:ATP-dependent Clp protease adaptor ClpS [Candidatus Delongbacteria bacterium]
MVKKHRENIKSSKKRNQKPSNNRSMVLYNDDINSFDFVIDCLVEICKHDGNQAEQCAYITHFKGKCDVKTGKFDDLKPMKDALIERGLNVMIE